MTLLGKIFRPWDLSMEDPSEKDNNRCCEPEVKVSKNSSKSELECSPEHRTDRKRHASFGDRRDRTKSSSEDHLKQYHNHHHRKHHHHHDHQHSPISSRKSAEECETLSNSSDVISSKSVSSGDKNKYSVLEHELNTLYNSSLALNNQGSSPHMFLHPTAVDDLAKLSRNELTAMGLLPLSPLPSGFLQQWTT
jgi:hypothetical protein